MQAVLSERAIEAVFGDHVVACVQSVEQPLGEVHPEERAHVARAVAKRQAEFLTARDCARRAIRALGMDAGALVPNPDRSPRWPEGVVGSISHSNGWCAVAVGPAPPLSSIGLDLEEDAGLSEALIRRICTRAERDFLDAGDPRQRSRLAMLIFTAKEAAYKCHFPLAATFLGFQDVAVELELGSGRFLARRTTGDGSPVWPLAGRFARLDGFVVSAVIHR